MVIILKKGLLIIIVLLLLVGCKKNEEVNENSESNEPEKFVLKKKVDSKDYIVLSKVREVFLGNTLYELNNLEINIESEDVDNINLEIKTFINNTSKNYELNNNLLVHGNVVDYEYYMNSKYLSVIVKYYYYVNGSKGEESDMVFNLSLETGKNIDNSELLKEFNLTEDELFKLLESKIESEDVLYSLSSIKNNGYKLFVNNDSKLGIIYNETDDETSIRKELIFD